MHLLMELFSVSVLVLDYDIDCSMALVPRHRKTLPPLALSKVVQAENGRN